MNPYVFRIIETIPLIYLMLLSIADLWRDFFSHTFFCKTVAEVYHNMNEIRGTNGAKLCANLNTPKSCPIFYTIEANLDKLDNECPKFLHDANDKFWSIIERGYLRVYQGSYFEVVSFQFIILGLTAGNDIILWIGVGIGLILLVFAYLVATITDIKPLRYFENKKYRAAFTFGILLFIIGLYFVTPSLPVSI